MSRPLRVHSTVVVSCSFLVVHILLSFPLLLERTGRHPHTRGRGSSVEGVPHSALPFPRHSSLDTRAPLVPFSQEITEETEVNLKSSPFSPLPPVGFLLLDTLITRIIEPNRFQSIFNAYRSPIFLHSTHSTLVARRRPAQVRAGGNAIAPSAGAVRYLVFRIFADHWPAPDTIDPWVPPWALPGRPRRPAS